MRSSPAAACITGAPLEGAPWLTACAKFWDTATRGDELAHILPEANLYLDTCSELGNLISPSSANLDRKTTCSNPQLER